MATSTIEPGYVKWMQKRGVAIFASFLMLAFWSTTASELDEPLYAVDDAVLFAIGIISLIILLYVYRNRKNISDIKTSLNIFTALIVVAILVKIIFVPIESSDADALGDEIPSIIIGAMILVSRFV